MLYLLNKLQLRKINSQNSFFFCLLGYIFKGPYFQIRPPFCISRVLYSINQNILVTILYANFLMQRKHTKYDKFSQPNGTSRNTVGQAYREVMLIMLIIVISIEIVRFIINGRSTWMFV